MKPSHYDDLFITIAFTYQHFSLTRANRSEGYEYSGCKKVQLMFFPKEINFCVSWIIRQYFSYRVSYFKLDNMSGYPDSPVSLGLDYHTQKNIWARDEQHTHIRTLTHITHIVRKSCALSKARLTMNTRRSRCLQRALLLYILQFNAMKSGSGSPIFYELQNQCMFNFCFQPFRIMGCLFQPIYLKVRYDLEYL